MRESWLKEGAPTDVEGFSSLEREDRTIDCDVCHDEFAWQDGDEIILSETHGPNTYACAKCRNAQ